jgi:hypothetical protein
LKEIPLIDEWFQYLIYLSDEQDQLIVNQFELGINIHSHVGLNFHHDLENSGVVETQHCFPTSLILLDQEQHDILKDAIAPPDNASISSSDDKETLNKYNGHIMLDASRIRKKGYFWKRIMQEEKDSWKEKKHVHMNGRPNDSRFRVFVIHCIGW